MKNLWLDCDPGHDDAMALILACHHPEIHVLGVSAVAGNQSVEKTTANAFAILAAIGRPEIPVLKGQERALMQSMPFCAEIHGASGLDGRDGKPLFPLQPVLKPKGLWISEMFTALATAFKESGKKVELVCTGSLTNAALLITLFPEVVSMVRITLMGGAMGIGNTGPVAEFNIENDPEAAHIVFQSGAELTMVPLEVTHTALVTPDILERIGNETAFRRKIVEMLLFFRDTYKAVFFFEHPPLHDPLAVFYVLHPEAFTARKMRVDIERASSLSLGQTVCDVFGRSTRPANCIVALTVEVEKFWEVMLAAVARADGMSRL